MTKREEVNLETRSICFNSNFLLSTIQHDHDYISSVCLNEPLIVESEEVVITDSPESDCEVENVIEVTPASISSETSQSHEKPEFQGAIVPYIAGHVGRSVAREVECGLSCGALGSTKNATDSSFLKLKDKGGLFKPSKDVVKICEKIEIGFLRLLKCSGGKLPQGGSKIHFKT